jgi:hypothetical protein
VRQPCRNALLIFADQPERFFVDPLAGADGNDLYHFVLRKTINDPEPAHPIASLPGQFIAEGFTGEWISSDRMKGRFDLTLDIRMERAKDQGSVIGNAKPVELTRHMRLIEKFLECIEFCLSTLKVLQSFFDLSHERGVRTDGIGFFKAFELIGTHQHSRRRAVSRNEHFLISGLNGIDKAAQFHLCFGQ